MTMSFLDFLRENGGVQERALRGTHSDEMSHSQIWYELQENNSFEFDKFKFDFEFEGKTQSEIALTSYFQLEEELRRLPSSVWAPPIMPRIIYGDDEEEIWDEEVESVEWPLVAANEVYDEFLMQRYVDFATTMFALTKSLKGLSAEKKGREFEARELRIKNSALQEENRQLLKTKAALQQRITQTSRQIHKKKDRIH